MLGYENEGMGDGLQAFYYNNENFEGNFIKKIEKNIDFSVEGKSPLEGISFENFSIKWIGWLKIPATSKYTFIARSSDGHSLKING